MPSEDHLGSGGDSTLLLKDSNSRVRFRWTLDYFERGYSPISIGFFLKKDGIDERRNDVC